MPRKLTHIIRDWWSKVTVTVVDQAVFSGANFVVHILLARWFQSSEYGEFVIIFSIFLIIGGIQNSLIVMPMSVFGPRHDDKSLGDYLSQLSWLHIVVTIGTAMVSVLVAVGLTGSDLHATIWALPVSAPLIVQLYTARRFAYMKSKPGAALRLSIIYSIILLGGILVMRNLMILSSSSAFVWMGIASFITSIAHWRYLELPRLSRFRIAEIHDVFVSHWKYGRWVLGESIAQSLATGLFPILLGFFGELRHAGEFRAMKNLVMPLEQFLVAMTLLLLPWASKRHVTEGDRAFVHTVSTILAVFTALAGAYVVVMLLGGEWLTVLLYGDSEYLDSVWLLKYFGAGAVITAVGSALTIALRAAMRPSTVFWSVTGSAVATLSLGIALVALFDLRGVAIAYLVSLSLQASILSWFAMQLYRSPTNVER